MFVFIPWSRIPGLSLYVGWLSKACPVFFQVDNASTPFSKSNPPQSPENQKILFWFAQIFEKIVLSSPEID